MTIKAALFGIDGTLVDSTDYHVAARQVGDAAELVKRAGWNALAIGGASTRSCRVSERP